MIVKKERKGSETRTEEVRKVSKEVNKKTLTGKEVDEEVEKETEYKKKGNVDEKRRGRGK